MSRRQLLVVLVGCLKSHSELSAIANTDSLRRIAETLNGPLASVHAAHMSLSIKSSTGSFCLLILPGTPKLPIAP